MAKIIVSCRFQKSAKDMADLIRYIATCEGVKRLPDTKKYKIATASQHDLILSLVKHFPQSKSFLNMVTIMQSRQEKKRMSFSMLSLKDMPTARMN